MFKDYLINLTLTKEDEIELRIGDYNSPVYNPNLSLEDAKGFLKFFGNDKKITKRIITEEFYNKGNVKYVHRKYYKTTNDISDKIISIPDKEESEEYYQKKRLTNITQDFLRLSHSIENEITTSVFKENMGKLEKVIKQRHSVNINKDIKMDVTGVNGSYQVEFELKNKNYETLLKLVNIIKKNLYGYELISDFLQPMNPHTLEKKDLILLMSNKYTLTDKADGERFFLYLVNGRAYLLNPKSKEKIQCGKTNIKLSGITVIDGEYMRSNQNFYAFDILLSNSNDVREEYLDTRIKELEKYKKLKVSRLTYNTKQFYFEDIFNKSKELWLNRKKLFPYELDGLIFTPVKQYYSGDRNNQKLPVFKWKELQSIDVRVEYDRRKDFTFFHHSSNGPKSKIWEINRRKPSQDIYFNRWTSKKSIYENMGTMINGIFYLGHHGSPRSDIMIRDDIVEYEWDGKKWKFLRLRTNDKDEANKYKTIDGVLRSIIDNISIEDLSNIQENNIEQVGNIYDITKDDTKFRDNWRKFHNSLKKYLIDNYAGENILELACGKGGDLLKWKKNNIKNVLAIDSSYVEIYGENGFIERLKGSGFKEQDFYYTDGKMNVCVIWGDVSKSVSKESAGNSPEEQKKIKLFFDKLLPSKKFDSIGIMYAIHYLFGKTTDNKNWKPDKTKLKGFVKNITELLKKGGLLYGVYLNGDNIKEDMIFEKDGKMFYKITNNKLKRKTDIESISIENVVWGKDVIISEPKLYESVLEKTFKDAKMEVIQPGKTVEDLYNEFTKKLKMTPDEKKLGMINGLFIFKK